MKKHKLKFILSLALIVILLITTELFLYNLEYDRQRVLQGSKNYSYTLYLPQNPNLDNENFYGNPNASITIVAFTDLESETSKKFIKRIFPNIKKDYIDTGSAKFYHKIYITRQDIQERNSNFKDSMSLECIKKLKKEEYYPIYFAMLLDEINEREMLEIYNIPVGSYNECMYSQEILMMLGKKALEIERLGIVGINQRFYIGVAGTDNTIFDVIPSYTKFQQAIRQHEIQIGN